jgi:hypothetical protein
MGVSLVEMPGLMILSVLFPLLGIVITAFMVWLAWRAVRALERIATNLEGRAP